METLAPPHALLLEVRHTLSNGEPLRKGVLRYLKSNEGEYSCQVRQWLVQIEQSKLDSAFFAKIKSPYRRTLLEILSYGWAGQPILETLVRLEREIEERSVTEIEQTLQKLPFQMMVPLLLFQFPAFLLLMIGPLLSDLLNQLSGGG